MSEATCPKCGTKQAYHGTCRVDADGSEAKMTLWHCGTRSIAEPIGEVNWRYGAVCKGLAFKAYTHERMDKLGAPHAVEDSEHTKAGCRIGGRFDWVEAKLAAKDARIAALEGEVERWREEAFISLTHCEAVGADKAAAMFRTLLSRMGVEEAGADAGE